jgi:hypothetical protein
MPPLYSTLSEVNTFQDTTWAYRFFNTHFNIILPYTSMSSKWSTKFRFPHQNPSSTTSHHCVPHAPLITSSSDHPNMERGVQIMKLLTTQFPQSPVISIPSEINTFLSTQTLTPPANYFLILYRSTIEAMHSNTQRHQIVNFKLPVTVAMLLAAAQANTPSHKLFLLYSQPAAPSGYSTLQCDPENNKNHYSFTNSPTKTKVNTVSYFQSRTGCRVVKVLRYKSEGRWFDPRWCHWNFSLTSSFRSHYGRGVHLASNRNEYRENFLGVNPACA